MWDAVNDHNRLETIGGATAIQVASLVKYQELITNFGGVNCQFAHPSGGASVFKFALFLEKDGSNA